MLLIFLLLCSMCEYVWESARVIVWEKERFSYFFFLVYFVSLSIYMQIYQFSQVKSIRLCYGVFAELSKLNMTKSNISRIWTAWLIRRPISKFIVWIQKKATHNIHIDDHSGLTEANKEEFSLSLCAKSLFCLLWFEIVISLFVFLSFLILIVIISILS